MPCGNSAYSSLCTCDNMLPSEFLTQTEEEKSSAIKFRIHFPDVVDNKINTEDFLTAASDVVRVVEKFGKLFAPVKHDMQGNINKLTTTYNADKENQVTLQDMILLESRKNESIYATDALMWLRRALHLILMFFEQIVGDYKAGQSTEDMVTFLRYAYQQTLEPYHGWMARQLFGLLSKMVPTRSQLLKELTDGREIMEEKVLIQSMDMYLITLRKNIETLETFYQENDLEITTTV